jgi:hypothetical protein
MAEITTGRVEGDHITLDERLTALEGQRVRITVEPLLGAPDAMNESDTASAREPDERSPGRS